MSNPSQKNIKKQINSSGVPDTDFSFYRYIFQKISLPALIIDSSMILQDINKAGEIFFNVKRNRIINKKYSKILTGIPNKDCPLRKAVKNKKEFRDEKVKIGERICLMDGYHLRDTSNEDIKWLVTYEDITSFYISKQIAFKVKHELLESLKKYQNIINTTHELYWIMRTGNINNTRTWNIIETNNPSQDKLDQLFINKLKKSRNPLITSEWEKFKSACVEVYKTQTVMSNVQSSLKDPETNRFLEFWESEIFPYYENNVIEGVQRLSRNLTLEKNSMAQLKESEEKYRRLVETVPNIFAIIDKKGTILYVNNYIKKITGYKPEELINKNWWTTFFQEPEDYQIRDLFDSFKSGDVRNYEMSLMSKNNEKRIISWNSINERDSDGNIVFITIIGSDVTEKKKLEERMIQSQRLEAVGTLAGGLAHDFNNILTNITGYTSLLKLQLEKTHPIYKKILSIDRSAFRAAKITKQLLSFAKEEKYDVEPIDLNSTVKSVYQIIRETFDKRIAIALNLDSDLHIIEGDSGQLEQILLNLCINARDSLQQKGTITIGTRNVRFSKPYSDPLFNAPSGSYVLLQVSDNGKGMKPEILQKIFEPFFTTKSNGTGMGLAMVYGIVKSHGGFIKIESELDHGSTFNVYFPRLKKRPVAKKQKQYKQKQSKKGKETILFIDNEENVTEAANIYLTELGYNVFTAVNGKEALNTFCEHMDDIDIVVLDVILPEISGKETFIELIKIKPDLKILISSGYTIDNDVREMLSNGALDFIQKPFSFEQLAGLIRKFLSP